MNENEKFLLRSYQLGRARPLEQPPHSRTNAHIFRWKNKFIKKWIKKQTCKHTKTKTNLHLQISAWTSKLCPLKNNWRKTWKPELEWWGFSLQTSLTWESLPSTTIPCRRLRLLNGFVKIDMWISLIRYMDLMRLYTTDIPYLLALNNDPLQKIEGQKCYIELFSRHDRNALFICYLTRYMKSNTHYKKGF